MLSITINLETDRTVAVQVLLETGLKRFQHGARSRHDSLNLRRNCRFGRCSTPQTDRRLSPSRPPHTRLRFAPPQPAPRGRHWVKLTGLNGAPP